jgi:shikimate kinase
VTRPLDPSRPEPGALFARNIVLIGFMGAGKSTVGPILAGLLDWDFIDLDTEIARVARMSVADLFMHHGEPAFRALEAQLTAALSSVERTVIAPGGGWITDPANLARLPAGSRSVWLRVSAAEAVRRIQAAGTARPLLAVEDPLAAARRLLEQREPLYRAADLAIDVDDRTPMDVAAAIRACIRVEA